MFAAATPSFIVVGPRQDIYRHLLALCNRDRQFAIRTPETEEDLEALTIVDIRDQEPGMSARGSIVGTVRLLPSGDGTAIVFDDKDALCHVLITPAQKAHFDAFWQRAKVHFEELGLLHPTPARSPLLKREFATPMTNVSTTQVIDGLKTFGAGDLPGVTFKLIAEWPPELVHVPDDVSSRHHERGAQQADFTLCVHAPKQGGPETVREAIVSVVTSAIGQARLYVDVSFLYTSDETLPYFKSLLNHMARLWPETSEHVRTYLNTANPLRQDAEAGLVVAEYTRPMLLEEPAAFARWLKQLLLDMAARQLWFQDRDAKHAFRFSIDVQLSTVIGGQLPLGTRRRVTICPGLELDITPFTRGLDLSLKCVDDSIRGRYDAILDGIRKRWPEARDNSQSCVDQFKGSSLSVDSRRWEARTSQGRSWRVSVRNCWLREPRPSYPKTA